MLQISDVPTSYAYTRGKLSVYNDKYCTYASFQIHEIGHNLGLQHSSLSDKEYGDESCLMGLSYAENESPHKCFNGAKSYALGWYKDKSTSVSLSMDHPTWSGYMVGVNDYENATKDEYVVVEVDLGSSNNLYLLFNNKEGINRDVNMFENQVTVTQTKLRSRQNTNSLMETRPGSLHVSSLSNGQQHIEENYCDSGVDLIINVCEIEAGHPKRAYVVINLSNVTTLCPSDAPSHVPSTPVTPSHTPSETLFHTLSPPDASSDYSRLQKSLMYAGIIFAACALFKNVYKS